MALDKGLVHFFFLLIVWQSAARAVEPIPTTPCNIVGTGTPGVADIQSEIAQALGATSPANDLNGDHVVNVTDVQFVIDDALGLGCATSSFTITGITPTSGPPGTPVTVSGLNLASTTQIAVPQVGGGTVNPPAVSVSATALVFVVPAGAATGPIQLMGAQGTATSSNAFTVTPPNTFTVSATPSTAKLIQGQSVSYAVTLAGNNGFNQLAQLSVSGVPPGVTAAFQPAGITAGQFSVLTLTAPANQPLASSNLSISASATIEGMLVSPTAPVSLAVVAPTTTLLGRTVVADPLQTPLAGVTITTLGLDGNGNTTGCTGFSTVSDTAGNFVLTNLPQACTGPQLIGFNGTTATAPPGQYAAVNLVFTLASGQVTASAVLVHLPRIDTAETFEVTQDASVNQTYAFATIPGLSLTVYAGTTFTLPDGTRPNPFPLAAVQVPVDRLPDNKPNVPTMIRAFIVAFQPANTVASQPVAVSFPNTLNTPPGTDMALMTLDPTHGQMVPYGTGAVSGNGTQIVPDSDPAHSGHLYGLVHFDWHGPMPPAPPPAPAPYPGCPGCCMGGGGGGGDPDGPGGPTGGDPVDLSSGVQIVAATDITLHGRRGAVRIRRIYRSMSTNAGPFGIGSGYNYGYQLGTEGYVKGQGMITLVMPNGNQYLFSLQANGTLINTTNPALRGVVISSPSLEVYNVRLKNGTTMQFQSPASGGLIAYLISISDPNGNTVSMTHGNPSSPDQITKVTDPVGRSLTLTYDGSDRIISITDPIGRVVTYAYNSQGTLASVTDAAGGVTTYTYNSQNQLMTITDARGVVMAQDTYDSNGRVIQQVQADGGVIHFAYALLNPLAPASPVMSTAITDPLGNTTTYRWDPTGLLLGVTDPTGQTRVFVHDPQHNNLITASTGPAACPSCGLGSVGDQSFTYDSNGNTLSKTDALGNTTSVTYEPVYNNVTSVTDPKGGVTTYTYDSNGHILTVTDANHHTITNTYNTYGQLTRTVDALGQTTTYTYDSFGNLSTATNPLGNTISFTSDPVSRQVKIIDALGRVYTTTYDALDRVVKLTDPRGNATLYTYDAVGDRLSATDESGRVTSYAYDPMKRLSAVTDPLGKQDSRAHDFNGNLVGFTDRRGQTSTYTYDLLNRLAGASYQDGSTSSGSYDANGRLLQVVDSTSGTYSYTYDPAGHLITSSSPSGTIAYAYDSSGRVASRQVAGQAAVSYTYDAVGNVLSETLPQAGVTLTYNSRNQVSSLTRNNGVASGFSYDGTGKLLSVAHSGAGVQGSSAIAYDAGNGPSAFTSSFTSPQAAANSFDSAGRLAQSGPNTYTYDAEGNLTSATNAGGVTNYAWDTRSRLQSVSAPSGQKTVFLYDFQNNLVSQADSGPSLNLTQQFLIDHENLAYVARSNGDNLTVLAGRKLDEHHAVVHANGQVEYGLADARNSTSATVDQNGKPVSNFSYDPYGRTTGSGTYPFQFTGRVPLTGSLYYLRARCLDSSVGRFISEDPISLFRGGRAYVYAGNSPVIHNDPMGLQPVGPKAPPTPGGGGGGSCIDWYNVWSSTVDCASCLMDIVALLAEGSVPNGPTAGSCESCISTGGLTPCDPDPDPPPPAPDPNPSCSTNQLDGGISDGGGGGGGCNPQPSCQAPGGPKFDGGQ